MCQQFQSANSNPESNEFPFKSICFYFYFRYGGLSFGSKVQNKQSTGHVSSILKSLISLNLTDSNLEREHAKIWTKITDLKNHFTTPNINKVGQGFQLLILKLCSLKYQ